MKLQRLSKTKLERSTSRPLLSSVSAKVLTNATHSIQTTEQQTQVTISQLYLEEQLKIYDWRIKTEFPIIKIADCKVLKKEGLKVTLYVRTENYPVKLNQVKQIALFKVLYLLKEAIIGFERLFYWFGSFLVTPKMIALNTQNKCKIWLNENFASNQFILCQMEESKFLQIIYKIFHQVSNKQRNTTHFFDELMRYTTFCQALTFIQNFARYNKISIPTSCKISEKQLLATQNDSTKESVFNPSLTMTRSPKFLSNTTLRRSLKASAKKEYQDLFQNTVNLPNENANTINVPKITQTIQMKTSGDTAPDIYGSNTLSHSNKEEEKEEFDESIIFGEVQKPVTLKIPESPLTFSKVGKRQLAITRHMSDNVEPNTFFTSEKYSIKFQRKSPPHFISYRQIESDEDEQNVETSARLLETIFQKNKWEPTLCGLFTEGEGGEMKKSTQHGVQSHQTQNSSKRLFLLQAVSKVTHESFMNQDDEAPVTTQL